ncbi:uncharacterized protein LOC124167123 [Ischnura elegans]|uniref:uncharacterized protein LOC124167123 n=1 Tax=Ischnura elegans TaxID=197161 RepID=UPI001ED8AC69|nr:uncharacterized protein LOC124167123 [Ischnura elegans]
MTELLHILQPFHEILPLDGRTPLCTPTSPHNLTACCGGFFAYLGVKVNVLKRVASGLVPCKYPYVRKSASTYSDILTVTVSVDGLPLSASSTKTFWPILGILDQAVDKVPFVIGIFYGPETKRSNSNEVLKMFVDECLILQSEGIKANKNTYSFRVSCVVADAPARSFVKCIASHNSLHGCEKCVQEDVFVGRATWPYSKTLQLRKDCTFKNIGYKDHQRDKSRLSDLDLGLVTQVPLD